MTKKKYKSVKLLVDGVVIRAPIFTSLTIVDIGEEMDTTAASIGYWANVLAFAKEDAAAADAQYRNWRARLTMEILDDNSKLAEWKVKAAIESHELYLELAEKRARANRQVDQLGGVVEAYKTKAGLLQSRGASLRAELEKTGVATRRAKGETKTKSKKKKKKKAKAP